MQFLAAHFWFEIRAKNITILALKITTSVLVTLKEILVALSQCTRLFKSLFIVLFISFIDCWLTSLDK